MVRMKDVAKAARVSVATVSNALSGNKYVSSELRERIFKTIESMGYKPSKIARSLKIKRTFIVGLIIPDVTNPYFAEIARGVEDVLLGHDYQMFLCNTDGNKRRERAAIDSLISQHVEGIINVAPRSGDKDLAEFVGQLPMVVMDRDMDDVSPYFDSVYTDNYTASAKLAEHFLRLGHKSFACLAGPDDVPIARRRLQGFIDKLVEERIDGKSTVVLKGTFQFESGYELMKHVLKRTPRPSAVFAANDLMAWGAVEAAKEKGLKIPDDVAIAGFDNIYFSEFIVPALTTFHQPKFEAGQIAMRRLMEKIEKKNKRLNLEAKRVILEGRLIVRESTQIF